LDVDRVGSIKVGIARRHRDLEALRARDREVDTGGVDVAVSVGQERTICRSSHAVVTEHRNCATVNVLRQSQIVFRHEKEDEEDEATPTRRSSSSKELLKASWRFVGATYHATRKGGTSIDGDRRVGGDDNTTRL